MKLNPEWIRRLLFFFAGLILTFLLIFTSLWGKFIAKLLTHNAHIIKRIGDLQDESLLCFLFIMVCIVLVVRIIKGKQIKFFSFLSGTITSVITFFIIGIIILISGPSNFDREPSRIKFDLELWRNQEKTQYDRDWPPRLCMVDDLTRSGRLKELTKEQVVELLGPTSNTKYFEPEKEKGCLIYDLRIESCWLIIYFDRSNKVKRCEEFWF